MPEGDTIHKLAAALAPRLVGERILQARLRHADAEPLIGRRVEAVHAHGKHLFIALDNGLELRSHLGMYGSWHRYGRDERWRKPAHQASIVLVTAAEVLVCFNVRELEWLQGRSIRQRNFLNRLGPDLLDECLDLDRVLRRVHEFLDPATPLCDLLLDQRVAAGIGNAYKSELIFLARRHPLTPLAMLAEGELKVVYSQAAQLLRRNLGGGPRITRWVADGDGRHWVYGRAGEACFVCHDRIQRRLLGRDQRSTYWCSRCQPALARRGQSGAVENQENASARRSTGVGPER